MTVAVKVTDAVEVAYPTDLEQPKDLRARILHRQAAIGARELIVRREQHLETARVDVTDIGQIDPHVADFRIEHYRETLLQMCRRAQIQFTVHDNHVSVVIAANINPEWRRILEHGHLQRMEHDETPCRLKATIMVSPPLALSQ